jgi:hypothetical protein
VIATANTPSENDSSRLVDIAEMWFAGRGPDPVVRGGASARLDGYELRCVSYRS